ncbi:BMP family ABC transporter substrate-binding protein, partial [Turicibacter sanguinis]
MAGGMYDKGVDIIFSAAAAVGNGVINEAKARTENQEEVYVIGVDIDQYEEGKLGNDQSVILTSAIKRIDNAAYDALDDIAQSEFRGG